MGNDDSRTPTEQPSRPTIILPRITIDCPRHGWWTPSIDDLKLLVNASDFTGYACVRPGCNEETRVRMNGRRVTDDEVQWAIRLLVAAHEAKLV